MSAVGNSIDKITVAVASLRAMITNAYPGLLPERHTVAFGRKPDRVEACYHSLYMLDIISSGLSEAARQNKTLSEEELLAILTGASYVSGILWAQGFHSGPMEIGLDAT